MEEQNPENQKSESKADSTSQEQPPFRHFNHFVQQLDTQQSLVNPTMNIINFYKVLFNEVSNINLNMNDVLDMYKKTTRELEPSPK
jgi:hypothetical protein